MHNVKEQNVNTRKLNSLLKEMLDKNSNDCDKVKAAEEILLYTKNINNEFKVTHDD